MAKFVGKGVFEKYSCDIHIDKPIKVAQIGETLSIPEEYHEDILAVRNARRLTLDTLIEDSDEIILFLAAMGG